MSKRPDVDGMAQRIHESTATPEFDRRGTYNWLVQLRCDLAELITYVRDLEASHDHPSQ